ncbi:hypothetical protein O181_124019, partial [Austropuccinia psidii MF-1]|nr:hypothetical protein [Austropuccinia psidii MF-1]
MVMNTQRIKTAYVRNDSIITNFEMELTEISLCQDLLVKHISTHGAPQTIAIFSDSQAALNSVIFPKRGAPGQQLTTKIYNPFQNWSPYFSIKPYWCPG